MTKQSGWIGVDLDGTLAYYETFDPDNPYAIGAPIKLMVERVRQWLREGYEVRVFTARLAGPHVRSREKMIHAIQEWCVKHIGRPLDATNVKDYAMIELWDDRAVQVLPNMGRPVEGSVSRV